MGQVLQGVGCFFPVRPEGRHLGPFQLEHQYYLPLDRLRVRDGIKQEEPGHRLGLEDPSRARSVPQAQPRRRVDRVLSY